MTFTLDEIRPLGSVTHPITTECAGNGRGRFRLPSTAGVQWQYGAVSTAEWTGVPLAALLDRAGLTADARHLWMEGVDHAPLPSVLDDWLGHLDGRGLGQWLIGCHARGL